MSQRTLEQKLKFDSGLPIGQSVVTLRKGVLERKALVTITKRGLVYVLPIPREEDMYTSAFRVQGDSTSSKGCDIVVWAAKSTEFMEQFSGPSVAVIEL